MHPPQIEAVWRPTGALIRSGRAAAAALMCTTLATGAHAAAGGSTSLAAVGAVFVGTWSVSTALASRRLATSQLVGLLLIGQVVVHLLGAPGGGAHHDAAMITAHLAGTALSAWLLRHGEDALWMLAEHLGLRASTVFVPVAASPWRPVDVAITSPRMGRPALLAHVIEGRGPPLGLA